MKSLSIKSKLMLLAIVGLLGLSTIIIGFVIDKSTKSLLDSQFNKLSAVEVEKKEEISAYFKSLGSLLTSLSNHHGTKEAFLSFEDGFYKLQNELKLDMPKVKEEIKRDFESSYLSKVNYNVPNAENKKHIDKYIPTNENSLAAQYVFILENSAKLGEKNKVKYISKYDSSYMQAHKKYHTTFDKFLTSFNLYDIFMVDLKGNLIYTTFKEKDFATNLKNGPYSNSGISKVYNKALNLKNGEIAFDDFSPYEPSYNLAASFISTPIFVDGIKKGVLIFQMPVDTINSMMSFYGKYKEAGLGDTGESYLVGEDYKMRNNSRFIKDIDNSLIQELGTTIGIMSVNTDSVKEVIRGKSKEGKWIIDDYRGTSVLSVYTTLDLYGQAKWALIAEIDKEEALEPAVALRNNIIVISLVVLVLTIAIFLFFINSLVAVPFKQIK